MVEPLDEGKAPQEARDELPEGEESAEPRTFRSIRPPKPLDEDLLDELGARLATMPEPVATLAVGVEIARAEGDATGVRKRLFELGIGIVRYGFSLGIAALVAKLGGAAAPRPLAEALARAARISDGMWCELTRTVGNALKAYDPALAQMLAFTSQRPLTELISARNDFIHRGGSGDNALEKLMALLENTEALLSLSLRCVVSLDPPTYEARMGTPLRGGVWRKTKGALPAGVEAGVAYVVREDGTWMPVSPYLPLVDKRLLFADGPHAPGKPWRCTDPEIGEHREHPPVDRAIRKLVGEDKNAPQELTDRPRLVGRDAAVKSLERAAEEAASGSVRMALVTGSFGVGRTRVADEIVEAAAAYGFGRVIDARCSVERRTPLRALRTAIEGVKGLGRMRDAIERALSVEAAMTRAALEASIEAIEEALVEASLEEPTVLDMDDAQWADEHTQGLLRMLTDRAIRKGRGRLFVIVTVRDEPNPSVALRRFVGRVEQGIGAGATRVMLDALSAKDASALVQNVAPIAKDIERAVVEGAGGVPFFLVQPLLVWNETGALVWRDAAWRPRDESILRASVPGVRDLLRARLDSFFDPGSDGERAAQHVLACVALYGSGLPVEQLVAAVEAAGTSARSVEQALELLVESGLLIVRGERQEHGFAQEIVRQAALEDVRQKPWFRRVHRSLLEAVGRSEVAEENAAFLAAGHESLGDREEAARWYGRAVAKALAGGEFERAMELAEKLAQVTKGAERVRAELRVVDALFRAGRAAEAKDRLERIHLDGAVDMGVRLEARTLTLAIAAILRHLPADHDLTLVADADAHGNMALRVETRLAVARLSRGHRGLSLAEEAIVLAAASPLELRYRAFGMRLELLAEVDPSDVARLQRATEVVRTAARELGSPWAELDADNAFACARSNAGDFATALPLFESISERAKRFKFGTLEREVLVNTATTYLRSGNPARAAAAAALAADAARTAGNADLLMGAQSVRADALTQVGELGAAKAAADEAIEIAMSGGQDYYATVSLLRRAEIRSRLGDPRAEEDAEHARKRAASVGDIDLVTRAEVWSALHHARSGGEGSSATLAEVVRSVDARQAPLRAPTKRLVDEARRLVTASSTR
ncbi:ATP-binding protein [Polyangium sorediatum]|uniref:AAA family ATPase n=1 Tax=Polyangium sorediatum TaxID=889274 RepID=A0ABT6NXB4_9BACT|nr:AAA family ATPase [Polyangium sorediatum]MDI1432989.1 AAA family ATPase [Polyangium sorediatum]